MNQHQDPVRGLTIFLVKRGVSASEVIKAQKQTKVTAVPLDASTNGRLYTPGSRVGHPAWASFFEGTIDPAELHLWTAGASAVLLVERAGRLFALAFGHGRHLVRRETVETTFGLRAALNLLPTTGAIRSIDRKTFEGVTTHVREQASKETTLSAFGLNVERDLLRAVVGTPADKAFGLRLAGMDALHVTVRSSLSKLPELLESYLRKSEETGYRENYAWIDNISEVRDPSVVDALEAELVRQIRARDFTRKWLAVPDLLDWFDIDGFRYTESDDKPMLEDIHFSTYVDQLRSPAKLDVQTLRRHRAHAFSAETGRAQGQWSVYSCIYAEIDLPGGTYLLNNGAWYQVDQGFVRKIDEEAMSIPPTTHKLIRYRNKEAEAQYNKRLQKAIGAACVMDAKQIPYGGGHSSLEFCDIFAAPHTMIHVKKFRGSSVLSHLFSQGVAAATAFVSDTEFRRELNKKLPPSFRLSNPEIRPQARRYEVAYVIAHRSTSPLQLPFFSKVTLRNARRALEPLGYSVTLTQVPIQ
ncbi:MAG: TIGR04141 family sporadically distributed protein [Polyangiaceae bacterium]